LFNYYGFHRVGILSTSDPYGLAISQGLVQRGISASIEIISQTFDPYPTVSNDIQKIQAKAALQVSYTLLIQSPICRCCLSLSYDMIQRFMTSGVKVIVFHALPTNSGPILSVADELGLLNNHEVITCDMLFASHHLNCFFCYVAIVFIYWYS
jgi:hypothetical protein